MKTVVRPVVEVVNLTATDPDGRVNVRTSARQPRSVVVKVPGPQGPTGSQGPKGDKGDTGDSALTFAVGTVTTGAAGSSASVTDVGSDGNVVLDFTIPRGDLGVEVDEGSGAADGDILVYDANADVWVPQAPAQPGKILQVVNAEKTDTQDITSLASGASAVVSGLAPSITLSSNLSKVMVLGMVTVGQNDAGFSLIVKRSGTTVGGGTVVGSRTSAHSAGNLRDDDADGAGSFPIHFVDSPSSTSQLDYTVELLNNNSVAQAFRINKSASDKDEARIARYVSTLTLMEIAG